MNIHDYLLLAEKTYEYRIKTVFPITDSEMDTIERMMMRYDPIRIGNPKKTIFQNSPPDFPTIPGAEVYIIDVELGLPISPVTVAAHLVNILRCAEKEVVVRAKDEPGELDIAKSNALVAIDADADEKGMTPAATLSDPDYLDADEIDGAALYGAKRNGALLSHLAKMADERRGEEKVISSSPLTSWDSVEEPEMEKVPAADLPVEKSEWRKVFRDREGKLAVLKAQKE